MAKSKIHVGLEIGSSKIVMVAAECFPNGDMEVFGRVQTPSEGILHGEVTDPLAVQKCIRRAWKELENQANLEILSVYLAVGGGHIRSKNHRFSIRLKEPASTVTNHTIDELCAKAQDLPIAKDQYLLHKIKGKFLIDDDNWLSNPEGLTATTLDVQYHIIQSSRNKITDLIKCIRAVPLSVEDIVFSGWASACYIKSHLEAEQKNNGVLIIDIGGGKTDYFLLYEGNACASGSIPLGGINISKDISAIARISFEDAEMLKKTAGDAFPNSNTRVGNATLPSIDGKPSVEINRAQLSKIINDRLLEIFTYIKAQLPEGYLDSCKWGIVLCGGTSRLPGIDCLAKDFFGIETYTFKEDKDAPATTQSDKDPTLSTVLGLIRFAQASTTQMEKSSGGFLKWLLNFFRK